MTPRLAIIKLRLRLNKSHSSDYDLIADWKCVEAINKVALEITRNCIAGYTQAQDGAEETRIRVDDLQFLLKPAVLKGINKKQFFEAELPEDYLWYSRVTPYVYKDDCKNQIIDSDFVEEANVGDLLQDWSTQPSFEWRQTFHTLVDNHVRVYTNGEFEVNNADIIYYRKPVKMDINGYKHEDGRESIDVDLEFKDDLAEIIIAEAAALIAGDIESVNQLQINKENSKTNI